MRLTGVPFERVERLCTPLSIKGVRELASLEEEGRDAAKKALAALRASCELRGELVERLRRDLGQGRAIPSQAVSLLPELLSYAEQLERQKQMRAQLEATMEEEIGRARLLLREDAATTIAGFAPFASSSSLNERLAEAAADEPESHTGWRERALDRMHLTYLQRLCAKNDTLSEFGPTGWGRLEPELRGLRLSPVPGISLRDTYLEKWVVLELAAAMNADAEVKEEIAPRLHPNGRIEGTCFYRADLDRERPLHDDERELLRRVDGKTAAHALGCSSEALLGLERDGVLIWELEPLTLTPQRMALLLDEVRAWRDGSARHRWLPRLEAIAELAERFARELDPKSRQELMQSVRSALLELGRQAKERKRLLYTAANPIGEECARDCGFAIGGDLAEQVLADAEPWFDVFADTVAFVRARVLLRLRELYESAPRSRGRVSLPGFLTYVRTRGFALDADGVARLGADAYAEVKRAVVQVFGNRMDSAEIEVTLEDCARIRSHLVLGSMGPRIWPSMDLQIGAPDLDAVARGEHEFVIGEMNLLCPISAHVFYWACPDKEALSAEIRKMVRATPVCNFSLRILDRATHVIFRFPDVFGDAWSSVAPERISPRLRSVAPADVDVALDPHTGELRVRDNSTGADLGAFLNEWDAPLGFAVHPFLFRGNPNMPRLRRGRTVLQRRLFVIRTEELPGGSLNGSAIQFVSAIEKLRNKRDLPRHIFVRPTAAAVARSSAEGRDKDVKPFYIDLESCLFLEALRHRLRKYGELEVSEMLPRPDQLLWREADGRRTFELRVLLGPAEAAASSDGS
jgi:hypothetical protein